MLTARAGRPANEAMRVQRVWCAFNLIEGKINSRAVRRGENIVRQLAGAITTEPLFHLLAAVIAVGRGGRVKLERPPDQIHPQIPHIAKRGVEFALADEAPWADNIGNYIEMKYAG